MTEINCHSKNRSFHYHIKCVTKIGNFPCAMTHSALIICVVWLISTVNGKYNINPTLTADFYYHMKSTFPTICGHCW